MRAMRHLVTSFVLMFGLSVFSGLPAYAQNKAACELLSKADAEAILGVTLQAPKPVRALSLASRPGFHVGHA